MLVFFSIGGRLSRVSVLRVPYVQSVVFERDVELESRCGKVSELGGEFWYLA